MVWSSDCWFVKKKKKVLQLFVWTKPKRYSQILLVARFYTIIMWKAISLSEKMTHLFNLLTIA